MTPQQKRGSTDLTELLCLLEYGDSEMLGMYYDGMDVARLREALATACGFIRTLTDDLEDDLGLAHGAVIQRFAMAAQLDDGEEEP